MNICTGICHFQQCLRADTRGDEISSQINREQNARRGANVTLQWAKAESEKRPPKKCHQTSHHAGLFALNRKWIETRKERDRIWHTIFFFLQVWSANDVIERVNSIRTPSPCSPPPQENFPEAEPLFGDFHVENSSIDCECESVIKRILT